MTHLPIVTAKRIIEYTPHTRKLAKNPRTKSNRVPRDLQLELARKDQEIANLRAEIEAHKSHMQSVKAFHGETQMELDSTVLQLEQLNGDLGATMIELEKAQEQIEWHKEAIRVVRISFMKALKYQQEENRKLLLRLSTLEAVDEHNQSVSE